MHYKEISAHKVWLPSVDPDARPLVTNPEGIEMFDSTPADPTPGASMPKEVELRGKETVGTKETVGVGNKKQKIG